ncbi:MAG: OmpA family protein [Campylobacterota bacterium]|nr:OmpA family protein [Campylobacterota bacterium]
MTHKLLTLTAIVSLFLSGCGQTAPNLDGSSNNISDVNAISGDTVSANAISEDTVSIDESAYGNESVGGSGSGSYNSSMDGFRSVYFDFGDYTISPNMENNMNENIKTAMAASTQIKIEGNCDEFGTDEYNYALGLKRAKAVKDALVAQGLSSDRTIIISFGESNPVCTEPNDSCYDRNRRVDIRLVK